MKIFKYHIRLYRLYEVFGEKIFYTKQADEAMNSSSYIYSTTMYFAGLERKKLVRLATREEAKREVDSWNFRCTYRKLTEEGLKIARFIENNKRYLTMFMLKD